MTPGDFGLRHRPGPFKSTTFIFNYRHSHQGCPQDSESMLVTKERQLGLVLSSVRDRSTWAALVRATLSAKARSPPLNWFILFAAVDLIMHAPIVLPSPFQDSWVLCLVLLGRTITAADWTSFYQQPWPYGLLGVVRTRHIHTACIDNHNHGQLKIYPDRQKFMRKQREFRKWHPRHHNYACNSACYAYDFS